MKAYNISINQSYLSNNLENIDITKINDLINDSVDSIFFNCTQEFKENDVCQIINILLEKIGINGTLNINIFNAYNYILEFNKRQISRVNFLQTMHKMQNLISLDDIIAITDSQKHQIVQISDKNYQTMITIKKVSL